MNDFLPQGHGHSWQPELVWLHVLSEGLIAASCLTIPITLAYFVRRRKDLAFPWVFWAFGLFIVSCGLTHVMAIWTLWTPTYWLSEMIAALAAVLSVATAGLVVKLLPQALLLPGPQALRDAQAEVARTEARFRAAADGMSDALYIFDTVEKDDGSLDFRLVAVNKVGLSRLAGGRDRAVGKLYSEIYPRAQASGLLARFAQVVTTGQPFEAEFQVKDASVNVNWVHLRAAPLSHGLAVMSSEVTERRKVERERELHTAIVDNMSEGLCLVRSADGVIVFTNQKFDQMLGYEAGELTGKPVSIVNAAADDAAAQAVTEQIMSLIRAHGEASYEVRNARKDGRVITCRATASIIRDEDHGDVVVAVQADITEHRRIEEERHLHAAAMKASLLEKEILLKEIHHRVKNNLQVISSLLKLHSEQITDPVAKAAFSDSQDRVRSIALLHEKLYQSKDLGSVNAAEYTESLVQTLLRTHGRVAPARVTISAPEVTLPIDLAVPCGLILNELITNALKHAFPPGAAHRPEIGIAMSAEEKDLLLVVNDNGVGLPAGFELARSQTLGMQLVRTLARQLGAEVSMSSDSGTRWAFRFPAGPGGEA